MVLLHDSTVHDSIRARVEALTPATARRWGRMSAGEMFWHCNQVLKTSLGDLKVVHRSPPFPVGIVKLILFRMPWPHNAPTAPEYQSNGARDFAAERKQCLELIERFTARKIDEAGWPPAVFGPLTGREWSCLHARHLDHHLSQFGT